jgi:bacillithiol system protein YtxJ
MQRLKSIDELQDLLRQPVAVIFKHSTRCPMSTAAFSEMKDFLESNPQPPVCLVDVIDDRAISTEIARITSVRHESPQVLILKEGRVVWHASHYGVTAAAVARELVRAG